MPPGLTESPPPPVTTKEPCSLSVRAMQLPTSSWSGATIASGRELKLLSIKHVGQGNHAADGSGGVDIDAIVAI